MTDYKKFINALRKCAKEHENDITYTSHIVVSALCEDTANLLEQLEQEPTTRNCFGCKYSKDNHNAGTEECHLCMWENQYTPTTKNDLGVDCISRTEVLKLIYDYKENHSENRKEYPINYGTLLDMIRWVRNLPSVTPQEPRWIPVSERYPNIKDEYKHFLVTDDKGNVSVQEFYISLDEEPQPYFSGMINVVAWMPLPKYETQESEET